MLNRSQLTQQQNNAVEFIHRTEKCALWADMGTGKTITTLTAIANLYDQLDITRVLVIAPLRVAMHQWTQEAKEWAHAAHLTTTSLCGCTPEQRQARMMEATDLHLINRELVPDLVKRMGKRWHYDCVVIDESSSFKSADSQRFKALKRLLPAQVDYIIELTGTPASNGYLDIWSQIYLLDGGERLGRTMTAYKQRYFQSDYMGYNWTLKKGAKEKIEAAISDIVLRMETPHTGKARYNTIPVELPAKAYKQYRELEKEFLLLTESGAEVEALTAASLTGKLQQAASGAVYTETGKYETLHDVKIEALREIIEGTGSPILCAYNFVHEKERLLQAFPQGETLDAPNAIERWNKGEIPLLFAHPASAGHGLNLQHGGHIIVWFGLNWSLELYQQFNARLHRQGQKQQVIIHHIIAANTVDETVMKALERKDTTQKALLNAMRKDMVKRTEK